MNLNADLQKKLDAAGPASYAAAFFRRLFVAALVATAISASTTCLTVWVSTLPAISPVSISLAFRSWSRIIEFNAGIWLFAFVPGALIAIARSFRPQVD